MAVPYTFGTATASIPLSQLDSNFATAITLGNTAIQLGNTVTTLNNMTLANVTISSGNITLTNYSATTANITTANVVTLIVTGNETVQGNTSVTGTATAAKFIPTGSSVTGNGMYLPATNAVGISTNGTNAVYIDASQNVGIGTSSPTVKLDVNGTIRSKTSTGGIINMDSTAAGTTNTFGSYANAGAAFADFNLSANNTIFLQAGTERMRIYSTGNISMAGGLWLGNSADPGSTIKFAGTVISNGAGTQPLKWNSTSGVVTYDTSSRLVKENIVDSSYGLAEILQLKSRKYFRIDDQRNEIGLIADEVQTVLPEFVPMVSKSLFTKNEADTELIAGGVNYDKLTSVLVKAIQEQQALITQLTDRIAALEAK